MERAILSTCIADDLNQDAKSTRSVVFARKGNAVAVRFFGGIWYLFCGLQGEAVAIFALAHTLVEDRLPWLLRNAQVCVLPEVFCMCVYTDRHGVRTATKEEKEELRMGTVAVAIQLMVQQKSTEGLHAQQQSEPQR